MRRAFDRAFNSHPVLAILAIVPPEVVREIRLSDYRSFWDQGFPALLLTDTSFLRNPHYHLASDMPDTLDYARLAGVTLGVAAALKRLLR